jgi:hypothetical protein
MLAAMTSSRPGRGLATPALAAALGAMALTAGCASAEPPKSDPAGVDQLVVPTPSPDPGDFVARVDNPWLPLPTGTVREYVVSGQVPGTRTVTVVDGTSEIAGVDVTGVRTVTVGDDGTALDEVVDFYAQDRAGNVWTFGREAVLPDATGSWRAGVGGAQAGLAMPAVPRRGDGFRQEAAPGIAEDLARVEDTDVVRSTPAGDFDDVLHLVVSSTVAEGEVDQFYAEGVGLVQERTTDASVTLTAAP